MHPVTGFFMLKMESYFSHLKISLWPFAFSRPYAFLQRPESQGILRQGRAEGCLVQVPGAKKYTCQRSRSQIQRERIHRDPGGRGEPKSHFLCQLLIKPLMHIRPLQVSWTLILCHLQKRDGYRLGVNSTKLHEKNKHLHTFHILFVRFFFLSPKE